MRLCATLILLLGAGAFPIPPAAQSTPALPAVTRTVVVATKLQGLEATPLYFKAMRVTIQPGEKSSITAANGMLYQISGSTEVSIAGEAKRLAAGEGLFIASGRSASLQAGSGEPSTFLHFLLARAAELDQPTETAPAVAKELYRTAAPVPNLPPGNYDFNLTRITFPAGMPSNAPHHRSGAALYYILSGTGSNTIEGKTETKEPGSLIYEPFDLVHQWGNPRGEPLTFLAFNVNPEGVPAVVPATLSKTP